MNIREDYDPKLYVGRKQELQLAQEWWESESEKRLLSVTAPPAIGKTWFLKKVEETFRKAGVISFWIDVRELLLPPGESVAKSRKQNPELVNEWQKKLVIMINQQCSGQLKEHSGENLEQLALEIIKLCQSDQGICFFIDEGDQFDDSGWGEFERKILGPLAEQETLRFVIAVREKRAVKSVALHLSEERIALSSLAPLLGKRQIKRLRDKKPAARKAIEDFSTKLQQRKYELVHPGLNNFICLFAEDNPQAVSHFNVAKVFRSAFEAVYPESNDDINSLIALLYRLSMLDDKWAFQDILDQFPVSKSQAWDYIQLLREHSLIKQELNLYEIVPEFRDFVRAILKDEKFYAVMPELPIDLPNDFHYNMDKRFTVEDLGEICFNLKIDPQNVLLGDSKLSKIIALIGYCDRKGRKAELIAQVQQLHPGFDWLQ